MNIETLVLVATLNEAQNLRKLIPKLLALTPPVDVLIVDDASPDGTGSIADQFSSECLRVSVIHRPVRTGLSGALTEGLQWAAARGYAVVVNMDADFSHDPSLVPRLVEETCAADLVIGSRFVPGGSVVNWPWYRLLLSTLAGILIRNVCRVRVQDPTSGFRAFKLPLLRALLKQGVLSSGYVFHGKTAARACFVGAKILEVPIVYKERTEGVTKLRLKSIVEAIWVVLRLPFSDAAVCRVDR